MASAYSELLRDPRWQRKRLEIMGRDEFKCRSCGSAKAELHVHHQYYISGNMPWDYDDNCFRTLCKTCHAMETENLEQAWGRVRRACARHGVEAMHLDLLAAAIERVKPQEEGEWNKLFANAVRDPRILIDPFYEVERALEAVIFETFW